MELSRKFKFKKYKDYINNRKLIFKDINKKTFSVKDLYAPIIGLNIEFENTQKIQFHLNKQKYFLKKKRKLKLEFDNGKKIKLLNNLKINSNTKIKKVEVSFLSYKPLIIN